MLSGIGADTHVQLCFQEACADDVCGPQHKRQKERIMGKKCKKQIRPNKHRWGTIHKSCGQTLDKLQDPIPGRPDEYYLPHCIADVSNGMKPGTVPRNIHDADRGEVCGSPHFRGAHLRG